MKILNVRGLAIVILSDVLSSKSVGKAGAANAEIVLPAFEKVALFVPVAKTAGAPPVLNPIVTTLASAAEARVTRSAAPDRAESAMFLKLFDIIFISTPLNARLFTNN